MLREICERLSQVVGSVRAHESDSSLIEQLGRQLRGKIHTDVSGVPRFACSSIINVTQIPRHCRTNDGHVLVVARVIYTANFYETPTEQLSEVLKTNIFARVVKNNAIC